MSKSIGFCEVCLEEREYSVNVKQREKNVRGYDIKYIEKEAICKACGNLMYVAEINDENLNEYYNKIRNADDIISIKDIEKIIEKYDIKKRPLSKLLGWGETTLTRYLDGSVPTKEYSNRLKNILNNVNEMEKILEDNKTVISDSTYQKCKKAIKELKDEKAISMEEQSDKIYIVTNYLIEKCGDITPLALQKMLYYCQAFCCVFTGKYLFDDDCQAWVHGPVYAEVYNKYSKFGWNVIDKADSSNDCLDCQEEEIVGFVAKHFGKYSGRTLELMTQMERPWRETRKGLKLKENSNRIIEKNLIQSYFSIQKDKYNMINVSDIIEYIDDLLKKI
ncbi:type II toxin-antitoxin system antitoxin SocA domain-containing protein [Intestinibacter sp.]